MALICIADKHRLSNTGGNQEESEESDAAVFRWGSKDRLRTDGTRLLPQISKVWDVQDPSWVPRYRQCPKMTQWIYHTKAKTWTVWSCMQDQNPKACAPTIWIRPQKTSETIRRQYGAMVGNVLLISMSNMLPKRHECFLTEGASCVDKDAAPSSPSGGFWSYSVGTTLFSFPGTSRGSLRTALPCPTMTLVTKSYLSLLAELVWTLLWEELNISYFNIGALLPHRCIKFKESVTLLPTWEVK